VETVYACIADRTVFIYLQTFVRHLSKMDPRICKTSLSLSGSLWVSLGLCGPLWSSFGFSGPPWASLGLSGLLSASVKTSGSPWGLSEPIGASLGQSGLLWAPCTAPVHDIALIDARALPSGPLNFRCGLFRPPPSCKRTASSDKYPGTITLPFYSSIL